jgi:NADPH:quinone reductase-like Zn-dependent oxidoreductase
MEAAMRAAVYSQAGDPAEVLSVTEVAEPHAGPAQIRVAVRAAGVNPVDWKIVGGMMGGSPDSPRVPGIDAAGVVDEVGEGVTGVEVGDAVFGHAVGGSAAEYAVLSAWAPKPETASFEVVGGLPVVGETAVRVLDLLGLQPGQTVVVDGASGGVGIVTVQLAVFRGLRVIGTAGEANQDFVRSLGAQPTLHGPGLEDRVRELAPDGIDGAVDTAGKGSARDLVALTGDPAKVVTIADFGAAELGVQVTSGGGDPAPRLARIAELLAADRLQLPIAGTYPLERIGAAYAESKGGHVRGKLVLVP